MAKSQQIVKIHPDGACSNNGKPGARMGCGIVARFSPDAGRTYPVKREWSHAPQDKEHTNNRAELHAVIYALERVQRDRRPTISVLLYTDSKYTLGVLFQRWNANVNTDLIQRALALIRQFERVDGYHVPGHSGYAENERADQLAREAITATDDRHRP
jgi:ribonuclease HI